jgi:hypothetical protein
MIMELKATQRIETSTAHISLLNDKLVRLQIKDNAHLTCENLEENYHVYFELLKGGQAPFMIIVNDTATISTEGREEFNQKNMREIRLADALIIRSPTTMLLVNSQVNFVKPLVPLQAFLNEYEAAAWLDTFL